MRRIDTEHLAKASVAMKNGAAAGFGKKPAAAPR
jgi:hypothetical protein